MQLLYINGPPLWEPGPGRQHYLPEAYYLSGKQQVTYDQAIKVTVQCVAQWADRYRARSSNQPDVRPEHTRDPARSWEQEITEVLTWLEESGPWSVAGLDLFKGDQQILDGFDKLPGVLALTKYEFVQLQAYLKQHGLPVDLYYPADAQQVVTEPVEIQGQVMLRRQRYSPLYWVQRDHARAAELRVPSDDERREQLALAYDNFLRLVSFRYMELTEQIRAGTLIEDSRIAEERQQLTTVILEVTALWKLNRRGKE